MSRVIYVLNGPNRNLLGERQPFRHHSCVSRAEQRVARLIDDSEIKGA